MCSNSLKGHQIKAYSSQATQSCKSNLFVMRIGLDAKIQGGLSLAMQCIWEIPWFLGDQINKELFQGLQLKLSIGSWQV